MIFRIAEKDFVLEETSNWGILFGKIVWWILSVCVVAAVKLEHHQSAPCIDVLLLLLLLLGYDTSPHHCHRPRD